MDLLVRLLHDAVRSRFASQKTPGLLAKVNHDDLAFLAHLVQTGKVTPIVERTYSLRESAEAIRHVESGHTRGKVVITVA